MKDAELVFAKRPDNEQLSFLAAASSNTICEQNPGIPHPIRILMASAAQVAINTVLKHNLVELVQHAAREGQTCRKPITGSNIPVQAPAPDCQCSVCVNVRRARAVLQDWVLPPSTRKQVEELTKQGPSGPKIILPGDRGFQAPPNSRLR